jgi:hypothetical protein
MHSCILRRKKGVACDCGINGYRLASSLGKKEACIRDILPLSLRTNGKSKWYSSRQFLHNRNLT